LKKKITTTNVLLVEVLYLLFEIAERMRRDTEEGVLVYDADIIVVD